MRHTGANDPLRFTFSTNTIIDRWSRILMCAHFHVDRNPTPTKSHTQFSSSSCRYHNGCSYFLCGHYRCWIDPNMPKQPLRRTVTTALFQWRCVLFVSEWTLLLTKRRNKANRIRNEPWRVPPKSALLYEIGINATRKEGKQETREETKTREIENWSVDWRTWHEPRFLHSTADNKR